MYTTLMMSTGLTFGSISALFGLTNHIIDERQYTILLTAVIGSAVVPTLIAQRWFQPDFKPLATGHPRRRPLGKESSMYAKILVANDGSAGGLKALTAAIELARQDSAELHMVTVEELPRIPGKHRRNRGGKGRGEPSPRPRYRSGKGPGPSGRRDDRDPSRPRPCRRRDRSGWSMQHGFDLLVVGFMGHSQLYERIIGGTTDRSRPPGALHRAGRQVAISPAQVFSTFHIRNAGAWMTPFRFL